MCVVLSCFFFKSCQQESPTKQHSLCSPLPHYFFMETLVLLKRLVSAAGDALTLWAQLLPRGLLSVLSSHLSGSDGLLSLSFLFGFTGLTKCCVFLQVADSLNLDWLNLDSHHHLWMHVFVFYPTSHTLWSPECRAASVVFLSPCSAACEHLQTHTIRRMSNEEAPSL